MSFFENASFVLGLGVSAAALLWAAASDFTRFLIPNRVCAAAGVGYLLAGLALPTGTWLAGLAIGALTLGVGIALFARGWVGGGDVKLATVAVLWAGPAHLSAFALATSLSGAALAIVMLSPVRQRLPRPAWTHDATEGLGQPMPFGVPLAIGGLSAIALQLTPHL